MRSFSFLMVLFLAPFSWGKSLNIYQVLPGQNQPLLTQLKSLSNEKVERQEQMNLRIKISKYVITKTEQGPKVNFTPVCEISSTTEVKDLTQGGLISEDVLGYCESLYQGKKVNVVVSGMIYDSESADFSDENEAWTRNFFAHLSLASNEIIFGLGDFNLDNIRDQQFTHLSSALSVDPQAGSTSKRREGFTARIRYSR